MPTPEPFSPDGSGQEQEASEEGPMPKPEASEEGSDQPMPSAEPFSSEAPEEVPDQTMPSPEPFSSEASEEGLSLGGVPVPVRPSSRLHGARRGPLWRSGIRGPPIGEDFRGTPPGKRLPPLDCSLWLHFKGGRHFPGGVPRKSRAWRVPPGPVGP